jgi:hypothetical protein
MQTNLSNVMNSIENCFWKYNVTDLWLGLSCGDCTRTASTAVRPSGRAALKEGAVEGVRAQSPQDRPSHKSVTICFVITLLRVTSWTAEFQFLVGESIYLSSTASRPALRPTQPPIQWTPESLSPGVKRLGHEADHSPSFSAEVKNGGAIPTRPRTSSWHDAEIKHCALFDWTGKVIQVIYRVYNLKRYPNHS